MFIKVVYSVMQLKGFGESEIGFYIILSVDFCKIHSRGCHAPGKSE